MSFPLLASTPPNTETGQQVSLFNLGLYLDRPFAAIPPGGLSDCRNVRIREGALTNENIGWTPLTYTPVSQSPIPVVLDGPVILLDEFVGSLGSRILIMATQRDLYRYDEQDGPLFISPTHTVGTATVTTGNPTVVLSDAPPPLGPVKAGDFIFLGATAEDDPVAAWLEVTSVATQTNFDVSPAPSVTGSVAYTLRSTFHVHPLDGDLWWGSTFLDAIVGGAPGQDYWYGTTGSEIVRYDGAGPAVRRDLGFQCDGLIQFQRMMIYWGVARSGAYKGYSVVNSAIEEPETVDGSLESGEQAWGEGAEPILRLEPLNDFVAVYGRSHIRLAQFVGAPVNFALRTIVPNIGIIAPRALANFGSWHEFAGRDRGYRFDGTGVREFGRQVMRDALRTLDAPRIYETIVQRDELDGEVQWVLPRVNDSAAANKVAWTECYREQMGSDPVPFTFRDLPATGMGTWIEGTETLRWDDFPATQWDAASGRRWNDNVLAGSLPRVLFGDKAGNVFTLNAGGSHDGAGFTSYARTHRFPAGDGSRRGFLKTVQAFTSERLSSTLSLDVNIWGGDQPDSKFALMDSITTSLAHTQRRYRVRAKPRWMELEFRTEGADKGFVISGYRTRAALAGVRT